MNVPGAGRYVVRLATDQDAASTGLRAAVEAVGGRLLGEQAAIHTAVVVLPPRYGRARSPGCPASWPWCPTRR